MKNKQTVEMAVTGVLLIVLVVLAAGTVRKRAVKKTAGKIPPAAKIAGLSVVAGEVPPADSREKRKESGENPWGIDPFSDPGERDGGGLRVTGIIFDDGKPEAACAIINDTVVGKGDLIEGYRVAAVMKETVVLHRDGETIELPIEKGNEGENPFDKN